MKNFLIDGHLYLNIYVLCKCFKGNMLSKEKEENNYFIMKPEA